MNMREIRINHDKVGDVLYILFGSSRPSYADEIDDGIFVRYDMETDEVTGITILDFSKRGKNDLVNIISSENIMSRDETDMLSILH